MTTGVTGQAPDLDTVHRVTGAVRQNIERVIAGSPVAELKDAPQPGETVTRIAGEPVKNLQRYLGAFGHAMMLSEDMTEHVHAHPEEMLEGTSITEGGGPDLTFHALFPKPGVYRIWLQYQRNGKLSTIPFTVRVTRVGETTASQ